MNKLKEILFLCGWKSKYIYLLIILGILWFILDTIEYIQQHKH